MCEPLPQKDGRFGDSGQPEIVLWTREVQETETVEVLLIFWRDNNSVNGTLDIASGEQVESVTSVDCESCILGLDPLPLVS